jgi:hypothetical protein
MNLQELRGYLDNLVASLTYEDQSLLKARLEGLVSVFPFNEYEFILTFLMDRGIIHFSDYEHLREKYVSTNRYLDLFGLAPRIFGQVWGEQHLMDLDSRFRKPDKSLDPDYQGQYDLWFEGLRIEVKAARAIDTKKRGDLVSKALRRNSVEPFWMNFQQLKLDTCDVFIFIGVWVDEIAYWVMSADEVKNNKYLSHQHRGGIEYQIGITHRNIGEFDLYKVIPRLLPDAVKSKGRSVQG